MDSSWRLSVLRGVAHGREHQDADVVAADASLLPRRSNPSGLYRLVALQRVRSRVTERGKVEFDGADCDAIRRARADLATA